MNAANEGEPIAEMIPLPSYIYPGAKCWLSLQIKPKDSILTLLRVRNAIGRAPNRLRWSYWNAAVLNGRRGAPLAPFIVGKELGNMLGRLPHLNKQKSVFKVTV